MKRGVQGTLAVGALAGATGGAVLGESSRCRHRASFRNRKVVYELHGAPAGVSAGAGASARDKTSDAGH